MSIHRCPADHASIQANCHISKGIDCTIIGCVCRYLIQNTQTRGCQLALNHPNLVYSTQFLIININISPLPARVELDDTISDVEDINLICSLIRKLVKFSVTSDYPRLSVKDLKDNYNSTHRRIFFHQRNYIFDKHISFQGI